MLTPAPAAPALARMSGLSVYDVTMAGYAGALLVVSALAAAPLAIEVDPGPVLGTAARYAALAAVAAYAYWRGISSLGEAARVAFWGLVTTSVSLLPMYLAARSNMPLRDGAFASMDRALGLEATDMVALASTAPALRRLLELAYNSLTPVAALALVVLPLLGRTQRGKELTVGIGIGVLITLPILALAPAIGPWTQTALAPTELQRACEQAILALRMPDPVLFDLARPAPIVAFPSWHCVMTILVVAAFWELPRLRWLVLTWGSLVAVSTLTSGWHYVVDVLAAAPVAAVALLGGRLFSRWEQRRMARRIESARASPI